MASLPLTFSTRGFMRPISHQLLSVMPALLGVLLVFLFAAPMDGGHLTFAPNIAWIMTLLMVTFCPTAWPRGFAFCLGLLQDVLFGTPLGSQALLTLLLAQLTTSKSQRRQIQKFRMRWLEAAGMLIAWHVLLWVLMQLIDMHTASLRHLVRAGIVNAVWYPVFYWLISRFFVRNLSLRD